jgi:hypothetical protein
LDYGRGRFKAPVATLYRTSHEKIDVTNRSACILRVVEMPGRGRAIVADGAILRDQLIERAPVLIVPEADRAAIDPSSIGSHIFMWEHGSVGDDIYSGKGRVAVVLGYASLVNHSANPNCRFVRYIDAPALDVIALRDIAAGEEITFDYGMKLWFTPD